MANRKYLYRAISFFFVLLLIIPTFGLLREKRNREHIAELENRTINPAPKSSILKGDFYRELEGWYNDRLLGRKDMLLSWAVLHGKLFNVFISKEIAQGKEDYLFMPSNVRVVNKDGQQKYETLAKIKEKCLEKGVPFYVFIPPPGEWMLTELLTDKYSAFSVQKVEAELKQELSKRDIEYVSIIDKLTALPLEERRNLFIEGDYHWNKKGAFIGAQAVVNALGCSNNLQLPMTMQEEEVTGDIYTRRIGHSPIKSIAPVPWNKNFNNSFERSYGNKGVIKTVSAEDKDISPNMYEVILTNPAAASNKTVLVLADSFMDNMYQYLLQDVRTVIRVHNCVVKKPKENIDISYLLDTYKPDAIVFEKVGGFFWGESYDEVFGKVKL